MLLPLNEKKTFPATYDFSPRCIHSDKSGFWYDEEFFHIHERKLSNNRSQISHARI